MALRQIRHIRPDNKGRITLGHLADGVSSYKLSQDSHNRIILEPQVEIPANEKWLFQNKEALRQVQAGLADSAKRQVKTRGSFAKYLDEDKA